MTYLYIHLIYHISIFWFLIKCFFLGFWIFTMSYLLRHLHNAFHVDQAIQSEKERVTIIRFGCDSDTTCMEMDEVLMKVAEKIRKFAVIYLVDIKEVPDFNVMYELYDPCTVMFFLRNKHIMVWFGNMQQQ